jgi:hypothetical protein
VPSYHPLFPLSSPVDLRLAAQNSDNPPSLYWSSVAAAAQGRSIELLTASFRDYSVEVDLGGFALASAHERCPPNVRALLFCRATSGIGRDLVGARMRAMQIARID